MPRSALPAAVAACGSVSKSDSPPPRRGLIETTMKKTLVTALLALTAALTAGAQSRTEVYTFPSEVLGAEKSCTVYLPDGYDRSQESYPVLYLLHGASGCHTDWTQKGDLRRIAD